MGFAKRCHYSVELISITDENVESTVFGVQVPALEEKAINPFFTIVVNLSFRDLFFWFAIMDFTKSMTSEIELPFLCYRAIETIKSRFLNDLENVNLKATEKDAWEQMHESLKTDKEEILKVKKYADPVRHGNYYTLTSTNSQQRFEILSITKNIILKYKQFLEDKFQITIIQ